MRRLRLLLVALLPWSALTACGGDQAPVPPAERWVDLARGFRPAPLESLALALEDAPEDAPEDTRSPDAAPRAGRVLRQGADNDQLWFEIAFPSSAWKRTDEPGVWSTAEPQGGALLAAERTSLVVADGEQPLRRGFPRQSRPGHYWYSGDELRISLPAGREPGDALRYRMRLDHGREVEGRWRVAQNDLSCDGFLLFPGTSETLTAEIPAGSRLGFSSVAPDPGGTGASLPPTRFRVLLDGTEILSHLQPYRTLRAEPHLLELGVSGRHTLTFEIEGEAPALIATPRLVPPAEEIGRSGQRPWNETRPDVVLVLCDTFRADNLAAWGGKPELAPRLNAFVERSLRFLDARSTAAWTLPSISTILSGVFPGQHGATDLDRGLAPAVETLAEVLSQAGYRTVALTDSGLFSRHYGQDQGFQWFQETNVNQWSLAHTLASARQQLAADDGRPLFLVVHTYRVHGPMRLGPEEDLTAFNELRTRIRARMLEVAASDGEGKKMQVALEFAPEGLRMYEDAVQDLDLKVGAWIEELERADFFERGVLVLTSDHGNSHGEHGQVGHGSDLYDVKLRVPLAFAGRGIAARAVEGPVSLVNLAPTVTALAGLAPAPSWVGRSLLEGEPSGPVYAFDLKKRDPQVALYAEGRKLMADDAQALADGRPSHAFDLGADPGETQNHAGRATWPAELGRVLGKTLEPLLVPATEGQTLELPAEVLEQLRAIGYAE